MSALLDILGNIGFDWRVALANLVNFLIILYLLKRFAFSPMSRLLKERNNKIQKGLEDADLASRNRVMAKEHYEQKQADAKKEVNVIIAEARNREKDILATAADKADEIAQKKIVETKTIIDEERQAMEREFSKESVTLVVKSVEKLLREEMTPERNEKLIRKISSS